MKFSPPQAKQNLKAPHPLSESCWDSPTSLRNDESRDIIPGEEQFRNPPQLSDMSPDPFLKQHVLRLCGGVDPGRRAFASLCSRSQGRLSLPGASRHAPVAPDCLPGTFQAGEADESGQHTQTVIHLFSSHRCSFSLSLKSS